MRIVVDTNILISAIIKPSGIAGDFLRLLNQGDFTFLYSESTLGELLDVLKRPRLRNKFDITEDDIEIILAFLLLRGEPVSPIITIQVCRDPKDNKFLEVAVSGDADVIVTGDEDLLILNPSGEFPSEDFPHSCKCLINDQMWEKADEDQKNLKSYLVTILPVLFGMLIIFSWPSVARSLFSETVPQASNDIVGGIATILASLSGIVMIIRREDPRAFNPIRGKPAVFIAVFWLIFWGAMGLTTLWFTFFGGDK